MEGAIATEQMRLLNRVTAIPLIVVCSLAVFLATFQQQIFKNDHLVKNTDKAIKAVRNTQRLLLIMESSYNSYVVTRRKEFLKQYQEARNQLPEAFSGLQKNVSKTGGLTQFIELRQAFGDWVVHSESLFGMPFAEGIKIFESTDFQRKGFVNMNRLRNEFDNFINEQVIIRNRQMEYSQKVRENFLLYGIILMLAVAIFLAWFFRKELKKAFHKYEDEARKLEESRNELKKTVQIRDRALSSRDDFISIASHELNTPLQSLKLQVQMLKRDLMKSSNSHLSHEKLFKFLDREDGQIDRLAHLVQDMLEITRLGKGSLKINKEYINLNEVIQDTIENLSELIDSSGSTLRIDMPQTVLGHWDRERIEQVFINLLTNAVKYGQGSPITISLTKNDDWTRVEIADQGRGIPAEDHERIFGRFERNISASEVSGLGLGLFITRQLVEAHGGHVWAESEGINKGAKFVVELPLRPAEMRIAEDFQNTYETLSGHWDRSTH